MRTYFDLLFGKEMQPLLDLFADDVNWFIVATGTTINGKEELKAGAQNHWAASPDRVKKLVNMFATDEFVSLEYTSGGTLEAQVNFGNIAIKPTGKKYELQCCFVFHFRPDGKIDRVREYFDMGTVTRQIGEDADVNKEDSKQVSNVTPFGILWPAVFSDDWTTVEAQLADDIEWNMMPNAQKFKGKTEVISFIKTSKFAAQREPIVVDDVVTKDGGVFEYWNIGTLTEGVIEFAKLSKWPFPKDPGTLVGQKYKVPVCFVYHLNAQGKINLVREYLDIESIMSQF
jgi:steroid delta-isomerase-like uncharacterized protein